MTSRLKTTFSGNPQVASEITRSSETLKKLSQKTSESDYEIMKYLKVFQQFLIVVVLIDIFISLLAPCVIFINEIDLVGAKRTSSVLHTYDNQTINQLLSEMDGFHQNARVIILGATNRRGDLDQALLTPARFMLKSVLLSLCVFNILIVTTLILFKLFICFNEGLI